MPADSAHEVDRDRAGLIERPAFSDGAIEIPHGVPLERLAGLIARQAVEQPADLGDGPFV